MDGEAINAIILEWVKTIFSYPLVLLIFILMIRSKLKEILASISHLKIGNIEIRMKNIKDEIIRDAESYIADKLINFASQKEATSPEQVKFALEVLDFIERPSDRQTES